MIGFATGYFVDLLTGAGLVDQARNNTRVVCVHTIVHARQLYFLLYKLACCKSLHMSRAARTCSGADTLWVRVV
jgi:hypothetical protein